MNAETCPICWEPYNRSNKKKVSCIHCGKSACKKCIEENLLQKLTSRYSQPNCSNPECGKPWNNDFIRSNLTQKFYKKLEQLREEDAFSDEEKYVFPPYQDYAKKYSKKKEKYGDFTQINEEIKRIDHVLAPMQSRRAKLIQVSTEMKNLRNAKDPYTFKDSQNEIKDVAGIKVCPKEDCRGYLNKNYVCGMCNSEACKKCFCIKEESHRCDPNQIKTVDEIKKISKACPTCGISTERKEGCPHMWCQAEDTKIWMWSGKKKNAKDILEGDIIIGDDGLPRIVDTIVSGTAEMYEVVQKYGDNYKVIGQHLLTLNDCNKITDISVIDYLKLQKYKRKRGYYRVTCNLIQWDKQEILLDPYILGIWLGDGLSRGDGFASNDYEITQEWVNWAIHNEADVVHSNPYSFHIRGRCQGKKYPVGYGSVKECTACNIKRSFCCANIKELSEMNDTNIISPDIFLKIKKWRENLPPRSKLLILGKSRDSNPLRKILEQYNLVNNKHIPLSYLKNDEHTRLQVLAGMIDTDGNRNGRAYRISQSIVRKVLCQNIIDICHSLGLSTNWAEYNPGNVTFPHGKSYEGTKQILIRISGKTDKIPIKLPYKKVEKSTTRNSTIDINPIGEQKYVGWSVKEGTPRYLLGDGTITHNCIHCKKGWNWDTEEVIEGRVVNPEYFDWINKNIDNVIVREDGDIPCGGLPDYHVVRRSYGDDICGAYGKVAHINDYERSTWITKVVNIDSYYVGYLAGEVSRKELIKKRIMVRNMEKRNREVLSILDTFLACCIDIFRHLVYRPSKIKGEKGMKNLEDLRIRTNIALRDLGQKYKMKVPRIDDFQ